MSSSSRSSTDKNATPAESWPSGLEAVAEAALPDFLLRQRWYPAKDAGRPAVTLATLVAFPSPRQPAALAIWRVTPPGQAPLLLFVPLALVPAGGGTDPAQVIAPAPASAPGGAAPAGVLVEAFSTDDFVRAWIGALVRGKGTARDRLRTGHTDRLAQAGLEPGGNWAVRRSHAEQSNTSIRIGEGAILKVIRKLEQGIHPELEVGRFLTGEAGFTATPALLGWAELDLPGATGSITLSVLQAFVPNQGDGWNWVLGRLGRAVAADEPASEQMLAETTAWLRRLGQRTAEMHRAFGIDSQDPAFRPHAVGPAERQGWTEAAQALARRVLDGLAADARQLAPPARDLAAALLGRRDELAAQLETVLRDAPAFARTRHHGDYHLGQVLVAGEDAIIIDFEGEPMRPLAERRAHHAPLRDVAGLLRSVAYAAAAAGRALPADLPEAQRTAALRRLDAWEAEASRAFFDAYLAAAQGTPGCPADLPAAARLVHFFMLERALYEIAYERANRPDWVAIPLRGVLALLDAAPVTRRHAMPFGAELQADGRVRFRLWAPAHKQIRLALDGAAETLALQAQDGGWHELVTDRARAGTRYRYVLPDGLHVPDPASRHQPNDVHGPSEVIDPAAHVWGDAAWKGRPWEEAVVYELHVGAFTPGGTFRAAIDRLDHLVALGVTAIEIMPVGDFPGLRNWGYDGVLPYAPDGSYGRPEDLKALVEAAHARGLMVLLDVVYNHFGPEGAYLHAIAPQAFTDRHKTPWGAAINTDGAEASPVRDFFIHNALYWIEEFHLDGLRLDAVHAILDDSPLHLLEDLARRVREAVPDRPVHLVLENEENQASRLVRDADGRPRWYTAQWNDDAHHVLHVAASGEAKGYYADYKGHTDRLGRALAEGFAFQGEVMPYRGHARGEPSAALPPGAFIAFIQNHDQVGNRAFGDRLTAFAPEAAVRAVASVYLLLPQVPMLFMGEEWAAAQPFPFFCDFSGDLAEAVRRGRREEFARFPEFQDPATRERIPDPTAEATFAAAKLRWEDLARAPHAGWLDWYRRVLALRHAEIVPLLTGIRAGGRYEIIGDGAVVVRWNLGESGTGAGGALVLAANLSPTPVEGFPVAAGKVLWQEGETGAEADGRFGPWAVRWAIEAAAESGSATLDELAGRMGIEPVFRDARGKTVRASAQTKRSLLAAMGVAADDEAQVRATLEALERADWQRPLPPVVVLDVTAGPLVVEIVLPPDTGQIIWHLALEDGSEIVAQVAFDRLDLVASCHVDGQALQRRRLVLPDDLPWGYHRFSFQPGQAATTLVVTPGRCWLPPGLAEGRRLWGIAAQLYLLRSATDWGIGDFGDLRSLVELTAARGADVIGLNPLHALFHDDPEHASPYSPASRLLLNVLNIDVLAVPELLDCPQTRELITSEAFRARVAACSARPLVDYAEVTALKFSVLEQLFHACRTAADPARWEGFTAFRRERGTVLERNCLFLALREYFAARDPALADWHCWPEEYRDPDSPTVARFAEANRERLDFLAWLQWLADTQLAAAAATASARGMAVGLYRDLAVGADRAGAETWVNAAAVVSGAQVGAPPDILNPAGQDWGVPPFNPRALREEGYRSFIELIRANMRHAGGLRIDHVMGLQHLYWVPRGRKPPDGAYVQYPLQDLVGILALESHRQRCLVVGEDLGTVPEGFREHMAAANILSYRVLYFEQDFTTGAFFPPAAYPGLALAVIGSHDLPTLRGWWTERDIEIREQLGLFPDPADASRQREARARDRTQLLQALRTEGLLPDEGEPDIPKLARAVHAFLARSPAVLAMAQIDDLTDEADPVNVPTTSEEHPNWRRRLSMTLEELAVRPRFIDIAEIFRAERGTPQPEDSSDHE
ncbi:malto-oligosyltrehalose trehalohydrolase [Rhodovastum atsumiense]|uniref:malto-oligosyltrehalose trehalohydrolase n=1 Tax=Rhodovastum atsumiense TaxID=504468 RepID=UPI001EF00607|nr:malto-oligosyltrehalose trehalohydrolase [Rhodovastum atsumiense]